MSWTTDKNVKAIPVVTGLHYANVHKTNVSKVQTGTEPGTVRSTNIEMYTSGLVITKQYL